LAAVTVLGALACLPASTARAFAPDPMEEPESDEQGSGVDEGEQGAEGRPAPSGDPAPDEDAAPAESATEESATAEPVMPFVPTAPATFPVPYIQRPLNLPRLNARAGGTLRVYHFDNATSALTGHDTSLSLALGGSFAVTDWLELGVLDERVGTYHPVIAVNAIPQGLVPLALTPDLEFGDIPVHARLRLVAEASLDISMDLGVVIPVQGDLALFGSMLVRARMTERFAIDSALEVALRFDRDDRDPHLDLLLTFSPLIQLHPAVFLAVRTGVCWVDFDNLAFPLGLEFGYTVANAERPLMDVTLGFGFPMLITPNNSGDRAQQDVWQVTLAGHAYFSL
jgi:hypothetical protein